MNTRFLFTIMYEQAVCLLIFHETFTLKYGQTITQTDVKWTVWVEEHWEWDEALQEDVWTEGCYREISFQDAFPGYTFSGWEGSCDTMPAGDFTLTAQWTPIDVKITLYPGTVEYYVDGSWIPEVVQVAGDPIVITAKYGDVIDLTPYGFTHEGYFMPGWNYIPNMTDGVEFTGELILLDGFHSYSGLSVSEGSGYYGVPAGEVYLTAVWVAEGYAATVTFNPNCNDYTGAMADQYVSTDGKWTALNRNRFVRDGYRFLGWSTEPDGQVEYEDGAGPGWSDGANLYAQWEKIAE